MVVAFKSSLYRALSQIAANSKQATIISGTNQDDLDDYRPGLIAADQYGVRHPFVECDIDKAAVRRIASHIGYPDLAELPASSCLSSRIETGLPIRAGDLELVRRVERKLQQELAPTVVRCRVLASGITVQLDPASLERLNGARQHWQALVEEMAEQRGQSCAIHFEPYRMGSAFVAPD